MSDCPKSHLPEFAFIGRSNVGKSSLINLICNNNKLAHTSSTPGKTKIINHFMINNNWFIVDLPGYGYAKTAKTEREKFADIITEYITKRKTLNCLFILFDSRLPLQQIDAEFIQWLGEKNIPFAIVFTKCDKLSKNELQKNIINYTDKLLLIFDEMPNFFVTSALNKSGKDDLLEFIGEQLNRFKIESAEQKN